MGRAPLHQQLETAFKLLTYLCEHRFGATIRDLQDEVDVTARTVYRFLQSFDRAGISITRTRNGGGKTTFRLANRPRVAALMGIM